VDSKLVGADSKTSDKVLERSRDERMMGSGVTNNFGWIGKCLMPDVYWHSSFFLLSLVVC